MWQNRFWRARTLATGATLDEVLAARSQVPMEPVAQQAFLATLERASGLEPRVAEAPFMMTWKEIHCLHAEGHEIGAHTLTHLNLRRCTPVERYRQIHGSKVAIEAALGHPVRLFSYPFGDAASWDTNVVVEARAAGFDYALTTLAGTVTPKGDRWTIPRICISRDDGINLLQLKRLTPAYFHHLLRMSAWTDRGGHRC
jgi:peptidoglycan/xylan/chitin deacetylase (PgdA/CDA1 family)